MTAPHDPGLASLTELDWQYRPAGQVTSRFSYTFSVGRWNCTEEHLESLRANMGIAGKRILQILDQNEVDRDQSRDRHHHPDMHGPALQPEEKAKRNYYDSPNDQRHPDGLRYLLGHRIQPVSPRRGQAVYARHCLVIEDLLLAGAGWEPEYAGADLGQQVLRDGAALPLIHQRPFTVYDSMRVLQGQVLDGWPLRRRKAARYPVDVGQLVGFGVGRGVCAAEGFPPHDDHEGQQHGVQDRNPREDEPRDLGVLLPLLRRPVPVNEIDTHPRTKQCAKENPEVWQVHRVPPGLRKAWRSAQGHASPDSQLPLLASPPPCRSPDRPHPSGAVSPRLVVPVHGAAILSW